MILIKKFAIMKICQSIQLIFQLKMKKKKFPQKWLKHRKNHKNSMIKKIQSPIKILILISLIKIKMSNKKKSVSKKLKYKIITIFKAAKISLTTINCWNQLMWIKWITSTFKISKKPIWHWNAKSKRWLNSKKMDLINLWSKTVFKTKQTFKGLIQSKKVIKIVRRVG